MTSKDKFYKLLTSYKFPVYLLLNLPAAFFSGIRIKEFTKEKCTTSVPYKWLTKNPFRSTYFASLAMAAEMSTGVLVLSNTYKQKPAISMLIVKMEANYFRKATGTTWFTCDEGTKIKEAVIAAGKEKEGKIITVKSIGKNKNQELVAEFLFTWSIKEK
jgi:acyl-coenzyme A thioesterase PaaI-like protein